MTASRSASGLRVIAPAFLAAAPAGVRIRTRLHPTPGEETTLLAVGTHLGSLYRKDLAARIRTGKVPAAARGRTERKRGLTALSSSRWAGSITRATKDQYQLGMRALAAEVSTLRAACAAIEKRAAVPCGTVSDRVRGYKTPAERHQKTRRLVALRQRLNLAADRLVAGRPAVVVGGGRLWSTRNNLQAAGLTPDEWDARWDASRMFLTADGESGKRWGNETIRIDTGGHLSLKVPGVMAARFGAQLHLAAPAIFSHRADEWHDRAASDRNIRYDISHDPGTGRWYVDASWGYRDLPAPSLHSLRGSSGLGVDLNAGHLAGCVIDPSGNPAGAPLSIPLDLKDLPATTRDGRLRAAVTALLDAARDAGCAAVAIENLNFQDARATGRETMGRGTRGKTFRRTVAGIPTARFRDRLVSMAANRGLHIIVVDPAYTSQWGARHWRQPLQQTTDSTVTRHHGAAVAIGRRAGGFRIRRREDGPRTRQRTSAGQPSPRPGAGPPGTAPLTGLPRPTVTNRSGPPGTGRCAAPRTVRGASTNPIRTN
ncbi:hypothetical protein [Pseudarthrobacter sp. H2]|uniref:hypothetical protein n=1 Tax=Pseudarthrobacter sp. H2 TaxID=3418415 RepID=UPI003CF71966